MANLRHLCLLLFLSSGLTAGHQGMGVRQYPASLGVLRGETATLSCHFKVHSLKYGVQWFKLEPSKRLIPDSSRHVVVQENQTSSLVIAEVALEDAGRYYCEVNVLQKDPERGNGTEVNVMAPPAAPKMYLQVPSDPHTGRWALLCLTGGFHPRQLTLTWTYQSKADNIAGLSLPNCTLPAVNPTHAALLSSDWLVNSAPSPQPACFQLVDGHSRDVYLFSMFYLPLKQSLDTGITFTCGVQDHPAMAAALTASFTWDASPDELMMCLNVLKMCFLSAMTVVLLLETVKYRCVWGK